ncbi:DUF1800 domain-containing protein [Methyloradius palustris]|uniref:DUF1800 domain-containing protein n=1 Tax=Methyloradius palustris TaxID=2778876 RepID=A0A8D5JQS5_9PROT|nr:DUF1800 domain-containing protein [Methyloradius palustris]BCM24761.1 hypothetical protein ZMTM_10200 [Methyloradius palustris]
MTTNMTPAAIAVNRFGLGARPDEPAPTEPKKWLLAQFNQYEVAPSAWANQAKTADLVADFADKQQQMRNANEDDKKAAQLMLRREVKGDYQSAVTARAESALTTPTPFIERLVHFWANHFAISIEKPAVAEFAGAFELEAIRPNVLGNFTDMLMAVETHPAMLLYLDQAKSIGPNSKAAERLAERDPDKKRGLNENLAREIMELHTLGVRSGYTQTDVTEFARAMTGWSIGGVGKDKNAVVEANGFMFRPALHEPGTRNIMGRTYSQYGKNQAAAVLRDIANSPATATHIATKLARHFVSDSPPDTLVQKLADAYMRNNGNLVSLYRVLIDAPEAWQPTPVKFKTPWEWLISSLRGTGRQNLSGINTAQIMNQLGQQVWKPGSPAGYDDIADSWAAPDALIRRVELAQRLANPLGDKLDARILGDQLLLGSISQQTKTAIARSESAATGLALLLVSPEFLRR